MIVIEKGNVLDYKVENLKIIPHIVNTRGVMGAGVALALSQKWPIVKKTYLEGYEERSLELGSNQLVEVEPDVYVVNMVAQKLGNTSYGPPIRYWALDECLFNLNEITEDLDVTIVCPMFGSGLAGGNWNKIIKIIERNLSEREVVILEY